jgi:phage tail sheath protein FI
MPEYLAPGVYIEEVSFRSKSIEGVSTTTTGFVGPTRSGPFEGEPDLLTSLADFERVYGDRQQLEFGDAGRMHNFMWHAARSFFEQGGRRLYVQRVFRPRSLADPPLDEPGPAELSPDGHADTWLPDNTVPATALRVLARFPGAAGGRRVRFTLRLGTNALAGEPGAPRVNGLRDGDVVWISDLQGSPPSPPSPPAPEGQLYRAERYVEAGGPAWRFHGPGSVSLELSSLVPDPVPEHSDKIRAVSLTLTVFPSEPGALPEVWEGLGLNPASRPTDELTGIRDSVFTVFADEPPNRAQARSLPLVVRAGDQVADGLDVIEALFAAASDLEAAVLDPESTDDARSVDMLLDGGNDGLRPTAAEYEGRADDLDDKSGLKAFEDVEDIAIVGAPGFSAGYQTSPARQADGDTIIQHLISHATRMRYRIAVLDCGDGQGIAEVRAMRARHDSTYAAMYYPWVRVLDPVTQREIHLPPSGFVAGIYASNDINRAVYKAPANEVVVGAIGFETLLNKSQQDVLNPEGINCFRFFEGRGFRLWGARTISSDPEWKYVNLRRYFAYLERSIDRGTQWAVFEPNGERLWANVRRTIENFLLNEWQMGALLGEKPDKAYFVRCDRSTMTQNDLDNGRLVALVGVAALRPAEFVIFRIGQWTADRKV